MYKSNFSNSICSQNEQISKIAYAFLRVSFQEDLSFSNGMMSSFNEEGGYGDPVRSVPPMAEPSSWVQCKHLVDGRRYGLKCVSFPGNFVQLLYGLAQVTPRLRGRQKNSNGGQFSSFQVKFLNKKKAIRKIDRMAKFFTIWS
jgi:hypothetical protein